MLDEIEGVLICPPTRAAERQSYRSAFDDLFTIELAGRGSRTAVAQLIDLSADGIGFRVNADLDTDERIRIAGADLGELDGAEHMRRCRAQIEEIRRGLDASAGPLSPADVRGLPNGGMGTRSRRI
jgi:hypothetical protein